MRIPMKHALAAVAFLTAVFMATPAAASEMAGDTGRPPFLIPVLSLGTVQVVNYTGTSAATSSAIGGNGIANNISRLDRERLFLLLSERERRKGWCP